MPLSSDSFVGVPVPQDLYIELARHYAGGAVSVVEQIVQDFLDLTAGNFDLWPFANQAIHWGSLFLPDGTRFARSTIANNN